MSPLASSPGSAANRGHLHAAAAAVTLLVAAFALGFGCTSPDRPYGPDVSGSGGHGSGTSTGGHSTGTSTGGHGTGAPGATCSDGTACKSGSCVDGVCCNSPCDTPCHACSAQLTGAADGDCAPVLGGSDPHASCPDDGAASCGRTGACSDKGACAFYAVGTECAAQTCDGSTKTLAKTCDGSGVCVDGGTSSCSPNVCAGNVCMGDCASDASCATGKYCDLGTGQCLDKIANGAACQAAKPNQCTSGSCADGVCCDTACAGACEACTKVLNGGVDGTCGPAPAGTDPDGDCADQGATSCGTDGACDGNKGCRKYASGTVCKAATCAASVETNASTCDGQGTCAGNGTTACAPFSCAGAQCASNCTNDAQCGTGKWCSGSACVAQKAGGALCGGANECASGSCVDGVCCDTPCAGLCQACSVAKKGAGSNGTCGPIVSGTDPDSECSDQGAATCGTDGTCDGAGACRKYPPGTACGATTCSGHTQTNGGSCANGGACMAGGSTDCAPYVCGATACKTSCAGAADCVSGFTCSGGACVTLKTMGVPCGAGVECASGSCVDGVCCNGPCNTLCQACTGAKKGSGADGLCGAIGSGLDPDNECADQGATTCGTDGVCNGMGACQVYASGTVCSAATCSVATQTTSSTCNGSGNCIPGSSSGCGNYVCGATACKTSCTANTDCASGLICSGAACVPPLPQGSACTAAGQCATGFCVDGFCCNTSCATLCHSCDGTWTLSGLDGTCSPIDCANPNGDCASNKVCVNGSCQSAIACP